MLSMRGPAARAGLGLGLALRAIAVASVVASALGVAGCSNGTGAPGGAGGNATGGAVGGVGSGGAGGSLAGGSGGATGSGGSATGGSTTSGAGGSGNGGAVTSGSGGTGNAASGGSSGGATAGKTGTGGAGIGGSGGSGSGGSGSGGAGAGGSGGSGSGGSGAGGAGTGGSAGAGFVDLFNGVDLTGFNTYKATSTANNAPGALLAASDAQMIFKPENGMIHVYGDLPDQSTQVHYLLQTVASYSKYNLSWDYKWGTKKFAPYTDLTLYPRDAGLLWHIHGTITQVWPPSIEFQNKWGTTGDIYALYSQCRSLGAPSNPMQFAEAAAGGTAVLVNGATGLVEHIRSMDWEMPGVGANAATGVGSDWNTCLLQVDGGTAVYNVNGHVVNRISEVMDSTGKDVTSGPVAWQAEQAEVYYRNLRIQVLP
jgi:Domain of Unknown Function (DUF1080)